MFRINLKRYIRFLFLILVFDLACISSTVLHQPQAEIIAQDTKLVFKDTVITQAPAGNMKYLGKFKVTFYWIVEECNYSGPKNTPLYLENGNILGYFPAEFVSDFKKEGCAELKGGKRISYLKKANKVRVVREFLGVNGYTISPFKSIAVDPDIIPIGSKLHIPVLAQLKDQNHNGIVYAHDVGAMINNHSIDIFVGYKSDIKLLTNAGINSSDLVDVYLLE